MEPKVGKVYLHGKTGGLYEVVAIGRHHENHTVLVVYKNTATRDVWVRELSSWMNPPTRFVEQS